MPNAVQKFDHQSHVLFPGIGMHLTSQPIGQDKAA
ncbi:hypothetical protein TIFTF001_050092, partial [Ficus carica]